jgi:hypothetical protein
MGVICACGTIRKPVSAVTERSASEMQPAPGLAPPGPFDDTDAKSVVGFPFCPRAVLKTW